jgi:hypothetical protein
MGDRCLLRNVVNAQLLRGIDQQFDDSLAPVCSVTQQTQVRKRFLRTSEFAFFLAELVGELDQEFTVTVSLVLRKGKDTGNVVVVSRFLLFREIANDVTAMRVSLTL